MAITSNSFALNASPGINQQIASVINGMNTGTPNAQQQTLINAFGAITTNSAYNDALHHMLPNFNSVDANIIFQNDTFKRIEQRVAALHDGHPRSTKDIYIAGDINYCNSMWISAFGGHTKQLSISENDGYKANSLGTLLGYDSRIYSDSALGFAVGMSGSTIDEYSNSGFYTDVFRYHALIYGAHNPIGSSFFDWVLSASNNNNRGVRPIFISGVDMSTSSDYNSTLISGKMTVSSSFDCGPVTRFTPLTTVQFTNINQPTYTESGGVAALNVESQSESIFTVGAGARFNFPINQWPCTAMRELRFLLSYDANVGTNDATANFVAGSNSFTVANPLSKLAVSMGAGLTFELADHLQFQANYDIQLRKRFLDQVAMLKLRYLM